MPYRDSLFYKLPKYMCVHMKEFNWSYPTQEIVLILEAIGHQIKSPVVLLELWIMGILGSP